MPNPAAETRAFHAAQLQSHSLHCSTAEGKALRLFLFFINLAFNLVIVFLMYFMFCYIDICVCPIHRKTIQNKFCGYEIYENINFAACILFQGFFGTLFNLRRMWYWDIG